MFFNRPKKLRPRKHRERGEPSEKPVYTFKEMAMNITKSSLIVINGIPCQVENVEKTEGRNYSCIFTACDIFTGKKYSYHSKASEYCDCPYVYDTNYVITEISPEGLLTLETQGGALREPLSLSHPLPKAHTPGCERCDNDCDIDCADGFITRYIKRLNLGRTLFAAVKSAMGKEYVCGILVVDYS